MIAYEEDTCWHILHHACISEELLSMNAKKGIEFRCSASSCLIIIFNKKSRRNSERTLANTAG